MVYPNILRLFSALIYGIYYCKITLPRIVPFLRHARAAMHFENGIARKQSARGLCARESAGKQFQIYSRGSACHNTPTCASSFSRVDLSAGKHSRIRLLSGNIIPAMIASMWKRKRPQ